MTFVLGWQRGKVFSTLAFKLRFWHMSRLIRGRSRRAEAETLPISIDSEKRERNWNFMTLFSSPGHFLIYAPTLLWFLLLPRLPTGNFSLIVGNEAENTIPMEASKSWSKARHVAMDTYHELIQLYQKLLVLMKFLVMLLNTFFASSKAEHFGVSSFASKISIKEEKHCENVCKMEM